MFLQGEIVKSIRRTESSPLFLMVLFDPKGKEQFNAVVLYDAIGEHESGSVSNVWNYPSFVLSNWDEFKRFK
jgi:hypothetical protein